jgi:hypothetical protein
MLLSDCRVVSGVVLRHQHRWLVEVCYSASSGFWGCIMLTCHDPSASMHPQGCTWSVYSICMQATGIPMVVVCIQATVPCYCHWVQVDTRALNTPLGEASLVPVVDMANHQTLCPNKLRLDACPHDKEQQCLIWEAGRDYTAGEEVGSMRLCVAHVSCCCSDVCGFVCWVSDHNTGCAASLLCCGACGRPCSEQCPLSLLSDDPAPLVSSKHTGNETHTHPLGIPCCNRRCRCA